MNILIKNTIIVTMNNDNEVIYKGDIAIEKNRIKYIGEVPKGFIAGKIIDGSNKVVMPGLINAHTHIGMSLIRGYADDMPLWEWISERIWPIEKKYTEKDIYNGDMLSIVEMIRSGTTCFLDMYFSLEQTAKAVEISGMRAVLSKGLNGEINKDENKFDEVREFKKNWGNRGDGRIKMMVAPHSPYTSSKAYLEKIVDLAKELELPIHVHISESRKEVKDSFEEHGVSPVKYLENLGLFEIPTVAAHCVHISDDDIEILSKYKVSVANNPCSNLKLANGFAPVEKMLNRGVNVALATDSSSSNNNLNMFEEIHTAALINKGINEDPLSIPAIKALEMATKNGAKALFLEDEIGSLEVGKKADMILIDLNKPHLYPRHDIISLLVYSAQGSDVETVIIDGKIVMENYKMKTIDESEVMKRAKESVERIFS
ncbi:amidohydrolase family protein [Clostridium sp. UBA6640]|uniref:amidohydrolase family protein n=1 Tax=Clostridium sp. UBA6640 TaxID=1946370 RepID=UPI0025C51C73|nr:amidohydrolase [Clostridium sp. UBA6640]